MVDIMIRLAKKEDINEILEVAKAAQKFLKAGGSSQWQDGYPGPNDFLEDIKNGDLYVCEETEKIVGIVALVRAKDENYDEIYSGSWLNDETYYSVHRLAVLRHGKGIASRMLEFVEGIAFQEGIKNLRADTTEENKIMQHLLEKFGYQKCGVVFLKRSEEKNKRIAYQKLLKIPPKIT
jgi:RimJ/RimL family protein N-acetyltransferase